MMSVDGGRKFFFPLIMKLPTVRYSPEGAVLETWSGRTQYAAVITLIRESKVDFYIVLDKVR